MNVLPIMILLTLVLNEPGTPWVCDKGGETLIPRIFQEFPKAMVCPQNRNFCAIDPDELSEEARDAFTGCIQPEEKGQDI